MMGHKDLQFLFLGKDDQVLQIKVDKIVRITCLQREQTCEFYVAVHVEKISSRFSNDGNV